MGRKKKTETTEEVIVKEKAKPKTKKKAEPKVATKKDKTPKKKMTPEEQVEFDELYEYIRNRILGYDSNQSLSRNMVLRLKGLSVNKFMENNSIQDTAHYSYKTILNTFKYCSLDIQRALNNINFNDESHKFNTILKIVEKNINTVYLKEKSIKKAEEKIEEVDTAISTYIGVEYKSMEKKKIGDKFKDLW